VSASTSQQRQWLGHLAVFSPQRESQFSKTAYSKLKGPRLSEIPEWGTDARPIHTWRNIFFFEGLFTVIVGLAAPYVMPTTPDDTWFLNPRERRIAKERLVARGGAEENEKVEFHHFTRSILNINNYICAIGFFLINITVQGISLFMVGIHTQSLMTRLIVYSPLSLETSDGQGRKPSSTQSHHMSAHASLPSPLHLCPTRQTVVEYILQGLRPLLLRASLSSVGLPTRTSAMREYF